MIEIAFPETTRHWIARSEDGSVLHTGTLASNQVVTTGQPVLEATADINEHLAAVAAWADRFEPLPALGEWLEAGAMYRHGSDVVVVRQAHNRTEHEPADVPALFFVAREPGSGIEWLAGEQVQVGDVRTFAGLTYRAVQFHVTQSDWTPALTAALWALWVEPPVVGEILPWVAGVYDLDVLVIHNGRTWKSLTAANSWEPGIIGSWRDQSDPPLWVQPSGTLGLWQVDDIAEHNGQVWRNTSANNSFSPGVFGWVVV